MADYDRKYPPNSKKSFVGKLWQWKLDFRRLDNMGGVA